MSNPYRRLPWIVCAALIAGACGDDGVSREEERKLFDRYVAIGNSITAGFESEGINDSTQANAYPVLLAARVRAPFNTVKLRRPGCPPPLVGPFVLTEERVGGATAFSCTGLDPVPSGTIQNLAFPGFKIGDVLTVPGGLAGLVYGQLFGSRTIIETMAAAKPSLVSVWLGNNDVLGAVTSGDPTGRLTAVADFDASLTAIVSAIRGAQVREAVIIGVANPLTAPIVQPGAYLWLARQDPTLRAAVRKPVNANCAPFTATGQANLLAANLVSLEVLESGVVEISCADQAPYVLTAAEQQLITTRVTEFNRSLRTQAEAQRWIYLDAGSIIAQRTSDPTQLRRCQGFAGATTLQQYQAALPTSCPHPSAPNFFGALISYDAVHPAVAGQRLIADAIEAALRAKHGNF